MNESDKILLPPSHMIYPLPAVLVSCGTLQHPNAITIAWTGTICSKPPMCYISVRPERYSHHLIKETGDFVINLCDESMLEMLDWCGIHSGRKVDKFKEMNLSALRAVKVEAPLVKEALINIECKVKEIKTLGSHDMFIAEIVQVHSDRSLVDEKGKFQPLKAKWFVYNHDLYQTVGPEIGEYGFTHHLRKNSGE
ncbi:MAG TPA: flavin reductase family protein [Bacteroidales bacterium]|jgi:flavin reductase (DIM6/NTAB) family NADH-FMN oxidoreductase RutF|nr:flavin reductase family protein [Bacteroidota bacterium]OQC62032.1 MAG: Flavoredoxin [Bacteroidetes bacterium ADurb.Bin012]HNQ58931.1 flavin reductase family protein [Bacteroidales bacterium]HNU21537.1 flavin reductase family protein [Bacteroidales bacterium]HNV16181.1 flavin reductase family protein [Bacteroidales bacterium]